HAASKRTILNRSQPWLTASLFATLGWTIGLVPVPLDVHTLANPSARVQVRQMAIFNGRSVIRTLLACTGCGRELLSHFESIPFQAHRKIFLSQKYFTNISLTETARSPPVRINRGAEFS